MKKFLKTKRRKGIMIGLISVIGVGILYGNYFLYNIAQGKVFVVPSQEMATKLCNIRGLSAEAPTHALFEMSNKREFQCYDQRKIRPVDSVIETRDLSVVKLLDSSVVKLLDSSVDRDSSQVVGKPVIYLYPEIQQLVRVELDYWGEIFADYPDYDPKIGGREVLASPDGNLINLADNQEYSYLFWEGIPREKVDWDLSKGFVVKGSDTKSFLQEKLSEMGLTPREYNEFIVYRFPQMQDNEYNLIHFAGEQYTATAPLTITPAPDSMLRVFMVWKALEEAIDLEEQNLEPFYRTGFSVIERGGSEVL